MGRLSHDPCIHHFSHPHPLHLSNLQSSYPITHCSACQLESSGWMYSCNPCNFTLHLSCSQLPSLITHPSHPNHTLDLLPSPIYPNGVFSCDACGHGGLGFGYHCNHCSFDIHTTCAQNPLSLTNQFHPHLLQLTFDPPYHTKGFSCDICQKIGSNHWLYRCAPCEFDAHLECAMGAVPVAAQQLSQYQPQPQPQPQPQLQHHNSFPGAIISHQYQQYGNRVVNPPPAQSFFAQSQNMGTTQGCYQQPAVGNNNTIMDVLVQGFVNGAAQHLGQNLVQSIMGGGGGDGNNNNNNDADPNGGSNGGDSSIVALGSSILDGVFGGSN
ncbi:uncharacterized protein LOC8269741 [Ricinus communis]|uniref:Protein binding protein, putative n=1 Tax=Ricinus communis TaxID=3988 RepID=B9SX26_RICCO|nr:uncharacterized protein LOC8269741 [Ricinus communis]EEF31836.1 protein binding protein, putative [Ricinus communis]|eukprot:XP_002530545.1 uncharacterized protein LOC8269741 [Ricinus communis]